MRSPESCLLNPSAYPDIVDLVFAHADAKTRLAMWGTHPALQQHINALYYAHAVKACSGFVMHSSMHSGKHPLLFRDHPELRWVELIGNIVRHCRIIDIEPWCSLMSVESVLSTGSVEILRANNMTDLSQLTIPSTVVLKCNCAPTLNETECWDTVFDLTLTRTVPKTHRLVYNVAYTWADALFASRMGINNLPESVKELVIHFKYVPIERARYFLCKSTGVHSHHIVSALSTSSPLPELKADEHLDVVHFPKPSGGSLFKQILQLYRPGL
jgi:hypothetical protein